MRLFQIGHLYPNQMKSVCLSSLGEQGGFRSIMNKLIYGFPKSHLLQPCLEANSNAFLSFSQEAISMRMWAKENGMNEKSSLNDILLSQIEDFGAEILYSVHASELSKNFLRRIPSCVKFKMAWLGSPVVGDAYTSLDLVVSNFPALNDKHKAMGMNTGYFSPSFDPTADGFGESVNKDIDILFVGGYSRHHGKRAQFLEHLANTKFRKNFHLHLDGSKYARWANTPLGYCWPLSKIRFPREIRELRRPPIFGLELFSKLVRAKIVVNMAIDMAGNDRGNIRCYEALSAGAVLLSDRGRYPSGFVNNETFMEYSDFESAEKHIEDILSDSSKMKRISKSGSEMIRSKYSKEKQWRDFQDLCRTHL